MSKMTVLEMFKEIKELEVDSTYPITTVEELLPFFCKKVDEALQRLIDIDNANSSKAIECLEEIENYIEDNITTKHNHVESEIEIIKQALIKAQEKEELLDYITRFIVNVEISDNGIYYVSFKNNTPYLDCIEIDKDHYSKFKKIKESQKEMLNNE